MPTIGLLKSRVTNGAKTNPTISDLASNRISYREKSEVPSAYGSKSKYRDLQENYGSERVSYEYRKKTTDSHLLKKNLMPFGS